MLFKKKKKTPTKNTVKEIDTIKLKKNKTSVDNISDELLAKAIKQMINKTKK